MAQTNSDIILQPQPVTFLFWASFIGMVKNKTIWGIVVLLLILGASFVGYQIYTTNLAHTTFERYYAFRGCTQLVDKTDTYGDCKLANGQTIKLVLINNKWYLDGDGPGIW